MLKGDGERFIFGEYGGYLIGLTESEKIEVPACEKGQLYALRVKNATIRQNHSHELLSRGQQGKGRERRIPPRVQKKSDLRRCKDY